MVDPASILTVGHSNHPFEAFARILTLNGVDVVADVRSAPYSRYASHFNRGSVSTALRRVGIGYVFLGQELGGRPGDPGCYEGGRIRYDRVARTTPFQAGLARVVRGARDRRVALMCAEREPLGCHRTLLIAQELDGRGVPVEHIHADGRTESHTGAMDRLLEILGMAPEDDLFRRQQPRAGLIAEAVARQTGRTGYVHESAAREPAARDEPSHD